MATITRSGAGARGRARDRRPVRDACVAAAVLYGSFAVALPAPAQAVPHGCASVSDDYSVGAEPLARRIAVKVNTNEPCTFVYAQGDTFSGSGRFTVTCSTGGYFHHPDFQGGKHPPVFGAPIPQPCDVGATVTLHGYHHFTGGLVVGGGLSAPPPAPRPRPTDRDFHGLCARGSRPAATVDLLEPVNYSGLLTYTGTVACDGADVTIRSLTVTPVAGYAFPSAGTARCRSCTKPLRLSGTVPAQAWLYEVEMQFTVTARGKGTVTSSRLGRYAVTWAGMVTTLCPGFRAWGSPDAPFHVDVPGGESCAV